MGCGCCKHVEDSTKVTADKPQTVRAEPVFHVKQVADNEPIRNETRVDQYTAYSISPIQEKRQTKRNLNDKAFVRQRLSVDYRQF
jgi:hypothetical protein